MHISEVPLHLMKTNGFLFTYVNSFFAAGIDGMKTCLFHMSSQRDLSIWPENAQLRPRVCGFECRLSFINGRVIIRYAGPGERNTQ
jgi:hypothetical protein